jgi:hypothetical protein
MTTQSNIAETINADDLQNPFEIVFTHVISDETNHNLLKHNIMLKFKNGDNNGKRYAVINFYLPEEIVSKYETSKTDIFNLVVNGVTLEDTIENRKKLDYTSVGKQYIDDTYEHRPINKLSKSYISEKPKVFTFSADLLKSRQKIDAEQRSTAEQRRNDRKIWLGEYNKDDVIPAFNFGIPSKKDDAKINKDCVKPSFNFGIPSKKDDPKINKDCVKSSFNFGIPSKKDDAKINKDWVKPNAFNFAFNLPSKKDDVEQRQNTFGLPSTIFNNVPKSFDFASKLPSKKVDFSLDGHGTRIKKTHDSMNKQLDESNSKFDGKMNGMMGISSLPAYDPQFSVHMLPNVLPINDKSYDDSIKRHMQVFNTTNQHNKSVNEKSNKYKWLIPGTLATNTLPINDNWQDESIKRHMRVIEWPTHSINRGNKSDIIDTTTVKSKIKSTKNLKRTRNVIDTDIKSDEIPPTRRLRSQTKAENC